MKTHKKMTWQQWARACSAESGPSRLFKGALYPTLASPSECYR
jgi:hypothetical protein